MADGYHSINGFEASHHRLVGRMTRKDTGCLQRGTTMFSRFNRAFAIDGVTKSINDTFKETWANRNIDNLAGTFNRTVSPSLMR
jgi:hypothetical protein